MKSLLYKVIQELIKEQTEGLFTDSVFMSKADFEAFKDGFVELFKPNARIKPYEDEAGNLIEFGFVKENEPIFKYFIGADELHFEPKLLLRADNEQRAEEYRNKKFKNPQAVAVFGQKMNTLNAIDS